MNIYNVIILDESGSMSAIYNEALTGLPRLLLDQADPPVPD